MNKLIIKSLIGLIVALFCHLCIGQNNHEIILGHKFTINSKILNEQRTFSVSLPDSYNKNSFYYPKKYPVLILLDGDIHFHSASGIVQFMSAGNNYNWQIPEMIVVAISNFDRERDYTPTHIETVRKNNSGGGEKFLEFLEKELIPHIDKNYRTMPFRTLTGHSLGGLLTVHTYMKKNTLFNAFIAIDPSLWWDEHLLTEKVKTIPAEAFRHNLFIASANNGKNNKLKIKHEKFYETLPLKAKENLKAQLQYFEKEDHGSLPLLALYHGLLSIFKGYKYSLKGDITASDIIQQFEELSKRLSFKFLPPESLINILGYNFLYSSKPKDIDINKALIFFELNVNNYPNSFNAYDSIAEAYKVMGKNKEAIKYYQKSLTLNPNNKNAKNEIANLQSK